MSRHAQSSIARVAQSSRAASTSSKPASTLPPLRASLILSRQPLLTRTPHPLEAAYFRHQQNVRHALSNPVPENFYFRPGSLPHRRWQEQEWQYIKETYGDVVAGERPKVGDIEPERPIDEVARDKWEKEDAARGERSLERRPEDEVFCVVENKEGGWSFPTLELKDGEALHDATERITGLDGWFAGRTMDTWLVTKKPIGLVQKGEHRTFFLRSHILAGEPKLSKDSPWKSYAWLSQSEVEERLQAQWDDIKQMFGVAPTKQAEVESTEDAQ